MVRSPAASHGTPPAAAPPAWCRVGGAQALAPRRSCLGAAETAADQQVIRPPRLSALSGAACPPLPQQLRRGFIKTTTCAFLILRAR